MRMIHIILLGLCGCVSAGAVQGAAAAAPSEREQRQLLTFSRMLTDPARSAETKYDAASLLLGREDQAAASVLAGVLADAGNPSSQTAVARAIADMAAGCEAFVDPLLAMLDSADPAVRQAAAAALGTYTDEAVLARVAQRAADPGAPEPTRLTAIESLSRRIDAQSVETLIALLESPQPTIQAAAAAALQQLTGMRQFGADPLRWRYWWQANQSKPRQQWLADQVEALTRQTDAQQRHIAALTERLDAALRSLYTATPDAGRQALILQLLRDTLPQTRQTGLQLAARRVAAAEPLAAETAPIVRALLADDDPAVRTAAARLAADLKDDQAVTLIMDRLNAEPATEVRTALIAALGTIGDARALDVLLETVAARPNGEAKEAALAVERLVTKTPPADERVQRVVDVLTARYAGSGASQPDLRRNLLRAMRAMKRPAFVEVMCSALKDPEANIRMEAIGGLAALGITDAADAIAALTADSDRGVRQAAIDTLAALGNASHVEAVLARTRPDVETDPVVRQQAWKTVPVLMDKADNEAFAALVDQLADRPDARKQRIVLMGTLIRRLAADKPRQVALRLQLAQALRADDRPAEAVDVLAKALPIAAAGDEARTVWLAWVDALLAADDATVLAIMNDQADGALFAAAVERLVDRLTALRRAGQDQVMATLADAAESRLAGRLTEAQQAAIGSLRANGSRPAADADPRMAELLAALAAADAAQRDQAEAALLTMQDRPVRPLLLRLRQELAAARPDSDCQTRLLRILAAVAPQLTGFDAAADRAAQLELIDRWIAQFGA
ncbi:MAG: hypothetical protein GX591_09865 [Planctomycetes bacterium]|nr:hypothetical protein [Planctomycetota bacterium]